jgi:serine/threonine protein kinase
MSTHYCSRCLTTFQGAAAHCPNLTCGRGPPSDGWGNILGPGDLLDRHYLIERVLAIGGAGLTYLAQEVDDEGSPSGPRLAIKVLYTQRDAGAFLRRLSNEAQILQDLDHPHIVRCRGFVHRAGKEPFLVTLFEEGGALGQLVEARGRLRPAVASAILMQVLDALDVAHQRGVVHRDLKPDNVLLHAESAPGEVPDVRVADFGIAKVAGGVGEGLTRTGMFIGTPEYAAPEQFEGLAPSAATDVFAAGGLLYFLLTGHAPVQFTHRHDIAASHAELLAGLPPQLPDGLLDPMTAGEFQEILDKMMAAAPGDRWTIQKVLSKLRPLGAVGAAPAAFTGEAAPIRAAGPVSLIPSGAGSQATLSGPGGATLSGSESSEERVQSAPESEPSPASSSQVTTWVQAKPDPAPSVGDEPDRTPATPPSAPVGSSPTQTEEPRRGPGAILAMAALGSLLLLGVIGVGTGGILWASQGAGSSSSPVDLGGAAHAAERKAIERSLARHAKDVAALCSVQNLQMRVDLTLAADGRVSALSVDPATLPATGGPCVVRALEGVRVPRETSTSATLRTRIRLQ